MAKNLLIAIIAEIRNTILSKVSTCANCDSNLEQGDMILTRSITFEESYPISTDAGGMKKYSKPYAFIIFLSTVQCLSTKL